jgi:biopolymer transport protein ExbB/TolQ
MLTNALYWLSTGMMVPVIILLLLCFGWALLLMGDLYGQFTRRLRSRDWMRKLNEAVKRGGIRDGSLSELPEADSALSNTVDVLEASEWHEIHGDKIICDFEDRRRRSVQSAALLMRVGPMLGLMGTLIPMGPALVGLAAGDIASMAQNMQVAFSTTVLGIFVGAVGLVVQMLKRRWYQADSELLRYALEVAISEQDTPDTARPPATGEEARAV